MLLFSASRSELDKCCPEPYNERKEALPPTPYWRTGKVLPIFVSAPLRYRAWRINPNTLSGLPWLPLMAAQDASQGHRSSTRSSGMQ